MKKLAIVAIGWHYPSAFYEVMAQQELPAGWGYELFVIGHRDPKYAIGEKRIAPSDDLLNYLDYKLYEKPVTLEFLEALHWTYVSGVSGCEWQGANLWLEKYNHTEYDTIVFCGDDALVISNNLCADVLNGKCTLYNNIKRGDKWVVGITEDTNDWLVVSNARQPRGLCIRGSFEFFKSELITAIGGKFDLSTVTLDRRTETSTPTDYNTLVNWNNHLGPFIQKMIELGLYDKIRFLSDNYRASDYIVECERGLLSNMRTLASDYIDKINELHNLGKFNRFIS